MGLRVKIFIDFWSFQLSWNEYHAHRGAGGMVRIPWAPRLYEVLVAAVSEDAVYAGTHVYASYGPDQPKGSGLRRFFNVMDGFTGYDVFLKERSPVSPSRCPNADCHKLITLCPHCQRSINRTVEKGVDTALVTDMIRFGIDEHYDRAVRWRRTRTTSPRSGSWRAAPATSPMPGSAASPTSCATPAGATFSSTTSCPSSCGRSSIAGDRIRKMVDQRTRIRPRPPAPRRCRSRRCAGDRDEREAPRHRNAAGPLVVRS
jgi:hypothetical protein